MKQSEEHTTPDNVLVRAVLRGDRQAFAVLIKNTEAQVAQIVFKMIAHAEDRKDLVQDIYLKAFHHLPGFRFQAKLSTWIAQIAYHTCFNFLEKKKSRLLYPTDDAGTADEKTDRLHDKNSYPFTHNAEARLVQKDRANAQFYRLQYGSFSDMYNDIYAGAFYAFYFGHIQTLARAPA